MTHISMFKRSRSRLVVTLVALGLVTSSLGAMSAPARAQDAEVEEVRHATYWDANLGVEIPGDLGQSEMHVWIPDTQHSIRGYMLDYWRAEGAASIYGNPISEPYGASNGLYSQAFDNGVFQFHPEHVWSESPSMVLQPVGTELLTSRTGEVRPDGKRVGGGGDRRTASWRLYGAESGVAQRALDSGAIFDASSGHSVSAEFQAWYQAQEGDWFLGSPLSQPLRERGQVVQYFEGAVLIRATDGSVRAAPVVRMFADDLGVNTSPAAQNGLPEFSETLLWASENPNPLGDPYAPGKKWLEISLSQQTLLAYQGSTLISSTYVSTGLDPNGTELGNFHVRYKMPTQDMAGTTNENGEVVALGQEAADLAENGEIQGESAYTVEDVPNVMYFNLDAEALHGAYWHNNFGAKMSHGCVNLPLYFATWLYGWAPLGTQVWVHE